MKINTSADLVTAIAELEQRKKIQEHILTEQFKSTVDHYKPKNLIKSALHNALEPGDLKSTLLKAAGGVSAGLLAKNLLFGKATSLVGKLASNVFKVGATNTVLHNTDKISAWSMAIYNNLFKKKK